MAKRPRPDSAGARVDVSRIEHENLARQVERLQRECASLRKIVDELLKKKAVD